MDIAAASLCGITHWVLLHLSYKDLVFFYHFFRDYKKAALSENIYVDWNSFSARRTRLVGHALILMVATGLYMRNIWIDALKIEKLLPSSTTTNGFTGVTYRSSLQLYTDSSVEVEGNSVFSCQHRFLPQLWFSPLSTKTSIWAVFWCAVSRDILLAVHTGWASACHVFALFSGTLVEYSLWWFHSHQKDKMKRSGHVEDRTEIAKFVEFPSLLFSLEIVVAAMSEEIVFRGILSNILSRRTTCMNIFLSSLIFSLCHVPKFALFLCEIVRKEFGSELETVAERESSGSNKLSVPPENQLNSTEEKEMLKSQATGLHEQLSSCIQSASRLHSVHPIIFQALLLNLVVSMCFGIMIGYLYHTAYHFQLTPLIVTHILCNFFSVPKFPYLRMRVTPFGKDWVSWIIVGSYASGIAMWLKLVFFS